MGLHYIAYYAEKKKKKLLDLPEQLVPIGKATAEYVTSISLESTEMRGQLHNLQKELDTVGKQNETAEKKDPFENSSTKPNLRFPIWCPLWKLSCLTISLSIHTMLQPKKCVWPPYLLNLQETLRTVYARIRNVKNDLLKQLLKRNVTN